MNGLPQWRATWQTPVFACTWHVMRGRCRKRRVGGAKVLDIGCSSSRERDSELNLDEEHIVRSCFHPLLYSTSPEEGLRQLKSNDRNYISPTSCNSVYEVGVVAVLHLLTIIYRNPLSLLALGWPTGWGELFSRGEGLGELDVPEGNDEDPHGMATLVSSEEVERFQISGQSAPGPDGILVQQWRRIPTGMKVVLFNLFLLTDDFPDWLLQARTVLLPKCEIPSIPSDFRPISISSVIMRHYHKIIAQRIQNSIKIAPQQRAFQCAGGLAENLSLLSEVLYSATSQLRSTYMAVLDVKKAFDTVQHGTTSIQLPGQVLNGIPVHQGVRQGDPLSPVLFNVVMDSALAKLNPNVGVQLGNDTIPYLAFADDIILMARSSSGLQSNLDILGDGLAKMGLMLSVEISHSLAIVAVGKTKKMKVLDEPTLRELEEPLRRISEAPLKPHQRMEILSNFLMPSLIHQLSFARVSMGIIKASVRRWLKLPKDIALGIFHAPPSSSGLGVPSFLRSVPVWILSRLRNVSKSDYPPARSLVNCPLFSRRIEWAERAATVNGYLLDTTLKVKNFWSARLLASVDGKDLVAAKDARLVPARDYISYLQIVSNSLPTKLRTSRGKRAEGILPKCRAGYDVESAYHIAQQCTEAGLRKPDLVAVNKELGKAVIMDVQVVQASNNTKIKKYATKDLLATVMTESGVKEVSVLPVTLTWKGSWFAKSASELQDIVGGGSLVTRTLFGTLLCWRRFMRSTTVRVAIAGHAFFSIMPVQYFVWLECSSWSVAVTTLLTGWWMGSAPHAGGGERPKGLESESLAEEEHPYACGILSSHRVKVRCNPKPYSLDFPHCPGGVFLWTFVSLYLTTGSSGGPQGVHTQETRSDEELRIMAREEVFLPENTRFVNQALVTRLHGKGLFVERTLDSIKSQRKQPKYQQLVREIWSFELSDPLSTLPKREGMAVPGPTRLERLSTLRKNLAAYMGHGLYHPDILMAAVDAAERGEPVVGFIDSWFRKVFRVEDCVKPLPENLDHPFEGTRRQILECEPLGGATYPPPPDVGAWWADLFSSGLGLVEEKVDYYDEDPHSTRGEISTEEVRRSKLKGQTSPGLDGIAEAVPEWMFAARTVLIPKVSQPTVAADFRPISIASVVLRHYHKVLGARIQHGIKILPEQRAFIYKDGLAENITLLAEVLHASTSRGKPLYAAVLDVRKAFDTVSHAPLMEVLRARGLPHNILRHIWQLYMVGKTTIQLPGKICQGVPVKQGVQQGDPLSPILFNIVMDEALSDQDAFVGFELGGEVVSRLAFADDVVLLAGSRAGLQTNLDRLNRALERLGLRLSAAKSFSLAMAAVPRERRVKFARGGVKAFKQDLEGPLERISSAPLKPFQRMELLKVFLLPSLTYRLSFAKVTMGALKACDVLVRAAVCRWLKLPHDTALGFFHAACSAGVWAFPVWSGLYLYGSLAGCGMRVEWARAVATVGGVTLDSSLKVKNYWRARWSGSVDGADLETARSCRESTAWIGQRASGIPSRDYISYLHISNSLPPAVRTTRGRRGPSGALPKCRAGCNDAETTYHVIQQYPRTHETRVARHNQVLKVVADRLEERGYRVLREPRYRTSEGVQVPDLVISKPEEDVAHVLDVQYAGNKDLVQSVSEWSGAQKVEVLPITISWKGLWHPKAVEGLRKLVKCQPLLCAIPTMVLFGTLLGWRRFGRATRKI
ncbi:hypothetical protein PR048_031858 [Dryococelus australis]|uniref:Reverse transcriptase domain-containing protein n=1 Tax=Dryococelus australis TaxID=614101 RepID=A0ABQ9GAH1_9NEOP|nr:hypothetical protein PR048_031858 [Dryococelus australis]